ncbi:trace amine-associated receptor 13c-like [Menidia menidia]
MMEGVELCFPQLNTSCRKQQQSPSEKLLLSVVLSSISALTASLNLLVIISISHFRQLHTPTNLLLLSLAVSDFLVGFLWFFQVLMVDGCWYLGELVCSLFSALDTVLTSVSVGNMVLISADRYLSICDPLRYPTKVTVNRVQLWISLCWTASLLYAVLILREHFEQLGRYNSCTGECLVAVDLVKQAVDLFLTFIAPVTTIICLYLRVFMVVVSQVRAMRSHITAASQQHSGKIIIKKSELNAAGTLGVVVVVFLMCLCPYFCISLTGQALPLNDSSFFVVTGLFYFNSCLNPLIYALFYPWFRKSIRIIVTLQMLKSGSSYVRVL